MREFIPYSASWLLTFLVHSTLWLGGAWLLLRLLPRASAALRDFTWRAALLASLLTPTAQLLTDVAPLGGALRLPTAAPALEAAVPASDDPALLPGSTPAWRAPQPGDLFALRIEVSVPERAAEPAPTPAELLPRTGLDASVAPPTTWPWRTALFGAWLAGAALAVASLATQALRLRRSLRGRKEIHDGAAARALDAWRQEAGTRAPRVRLTSTEHLDVPIALGVLRPEICVPRRALRDLGPAQQRALVGHELAHLLRRDPFWLSFFTCVERALWFQPLLRLARRGAQRAAEEACDAWAARRTGDPVTLADTLVEVARWITPQRRALAAACMARPDSPLRHRVTRLLDGVEERRERMPVWARAGVGAAMTGAVVLMSGVSCHAEPVWPAGAYVVPADATPASELAVIREQIGWLAAELEAARAEANEAGRPGAGGHADVTPRIVAIQERLAALQEMVDDLSAQIHHQSQATSSR